MPNRFNVLSASEATRTGIGNSMTTVHTGSNTPVGARTMVLQLDLSNVSGAAIFVSVRINNGASGPYLIKDAPIPAGSTLEVGQNQKLMLEANDTIDVISNSPASLDVIGSVMEDVNQV